MVTPKIKVQSFSLVKQILPAFEIDMWSSFLVSYPHHITTAASGCSWAHRGWMLNKQPVYLTQCKLSARQIAITKPSLCDIAVENC